MLCRATSARTLHSITRDAAFLGLTLNDYVAGFGSYFDSDPESGEWWQGRLIYELTLGSAGWWVDVEHPESMAAIRNGAGRLLRQAGVDRLTRATLSGESRIATTIVATWIKAQTLEDGSSPLGIRYASKVGHGYSWAYWPRANKSQDTMSSDGGTEIHGTNRDLLAAAHRFGLRTA
ncbi:hypothetical protein [Arthrobacter sp. CAN_C5]|uniref:hypothetical protein n=1 Tax=Arthrobacter sp. CAN_C5 TaxID=2760706 RepID=UPI001AE4BCA1|nr:hypothetical protein [Arthrobacter sp. CAN_C5]MBP2216048.1 hypothetical protein [Arthrobacter sp. CAN_C5]